MAAAVVLAAVSSTPVTDGFRYGLIVVLGISMGIQNAAARKLAVPDLTTTVLTMTITGITADGPIAGKTGAKAGRRGLTVVAMFVGALDRSARASCIPRRVYPLVIALIVAAAVSGTTRVLGAGNPAVGRRRPLTAVCGCGARSHPGPVLRLGWAAQADCCGVG